MGLLKNKIYCLVFICNEYPPAPGGGIGVIVKSMAEGLAKRGAHVIVLGYDPSVLEDSTKVEAGVRVIRLYDRYEKKKPFRIGHYYISLKQFWKRLFLSKKLESVIKEFNVDIVESYDWSGPLWKKPSVPLVVRMHGANGAYSYYEGIRSSWLLRFFENRNLRIADSLCAVSEHIGSITKKAFELDSHYTVIYNSTNIIQFRYQQNVVRDFNQILYVGRIVKRKGLIELFKIINILFDLNSKLYIRLVGKRNAEFIDELLQLIDTSKSKRVQFLDFVSNENLPELYSEAGIFVMPSRAEAFGITAIEAMSCSTPVVLTNKASGPEIVDDGIDGYLLDFTNPGAAAEKLNNVLLDRTKLNALGQAARDKVLSKFTTEIINSANMEFYKRLKGEV